MVGCCFKNDGTQNRLSLLAVGMESSQLVIHLFTVSVPVYILQIEIGAIWYMADSDVHLQTNEEW